MAHITLILDLPDDLDPALVDPHEPAQDIVDIYNEWAGHNGEPRVRFVGAEWGRATLPSVD